jgi:hypothetical protein
MEVHSDLVIDAITHAVRAVQRRSEGLDLVADRHSKAASAALGRITTGAGGLEIADARFTAYSRGVDCRGLR